MWHLSPASTGTLRDPAPTSLAARRGAAPHARRVRRRRPTPPAPPSRSSRSSTAASTPAWSAGATPTGDGEWAVTIRCAEVAGRAAARSSRAPGSSAGSRPEAELAETERQVPHAALGARAGGHAVTTSRPPPSSEGVVPYPPEVAERYRAAGYWTGETFGGLLDAARRRARRRARPSSAPAVGTAALDLRRARRPRRPAGRRAGRAAACAPATASSCSCRTCAEFLEVVFALFRLGALPVFALPAHRASEIRYFCRARRGGRVSSSPAGTTASTTRGGARGRRPRSPPCGTWWSPRRRPELPVGASPSDRCADAARRLPGADADPASIAFLQLSGGSTGLPKLIPRTHDDYLYSVRASAEICGLDAGHASTSRALPVAHNFPMSSPGRARRAVRRRHGRCSRPRPTPTRASG